MAFDLFQVDANFFVQNYPVILGFNAAGTITEVGPNVKDFSVGDKVCFSILINQTSLP
jgi:D-arabinose 1-dehydrogenase-like Zn-dependent alcohol dehydrogenase